MSYNATKKRALDENRNINSRRTSVRSCIEICTFYSGLNGYTSIDKYYNQTIGLSSEKLDTLSINIILNELTELREHSKQIRQEYLNYRNKQKKSGLRTLSKKEEIINKENWKRINILWNKFDTDENRLKKELRISQRRKEIDDYFNKTNQIISKKISWTKQFELGKEYLKKLYSTLMTKK